MKKQIVLPEYISIEHYKTIENTEHLSYLERMVKIVAAIANTDEEEVRTWDLDDLRNLFSGITDNLFDFTPILLPVFEFDGQLWGMQSLAKMNVGEYIDFENTLKGADVARMMAIIYRPITRNNLGSAEWKIKTNLKYAVGQTENLFKYYDIEKYDNKKVESRKEILKHLPISIAIGALTFFLSIGMILQKSIILSSETMSKEEKKIVGNEMEKIMKSLFPSIGGGSGFSLN